MSTTESSATDEKTEDTGSSSDKADWKGFSKNFTNSLITGIFLGVVVIGSMGLFLAKVANANILPVDCDIEPYPLTDTPKVPPRAVPDEIIYMNPVKIFSMFGLKFWGETTDYYIQEANFVNEGANLNFMNDFKNSWLCSLRNKAYPTMDKSKKDTSEVLGTSISNNNNPPSNSPPNLPSGPREFELQNNNNSNDSNKSIIKPKLNKLPQNSPFWAYEFETLKKMTCTSFSIINKIFFYMNYLPEWATMFIFALFFSLIITLIFFANLISGLWAHVSNFGSMIDHLYNPVEFNRGLSGVVEDKSPWYKKWSTITNPFYVFVYFVGALYSALFISPTIVTFYAFFKALSANYVVRDKKSNLSPKDAPKQNVFSFIKNTLYYKKTFLIILVMINLMGITNEYLGTSYLPGVIIAILILIFGLKILETNVPEELCLVVNNNFPSLKQPEVDIDYVKTLTAVDMCDNKPTKIVSDPKAIVTVTGYQGSNVLENKKPSTAPSAPPNPLKGGRSIPVKGKPKTKLYNLKLV
jgi:hypothetical protein